MHDIIDNTHFFRLISTFTGFVQRRIDPRGIQGDLVMMGRGNLAANERILIVSAAARCNDECGMMATTVEQSSIEWRRSTAQGSRGQYTAARQLAHDGCCVRAVVSGIDR